MKKYFTFMLAIGMTMAITIKANAITTGKWDFSGINNAIQTAAKDEEPTVGEDASLLPDYLIEQTHRAKRAQYITAQRYWSR